MQSLDLAVRLVKFLCGQQFTDSITQFNKRLCPLVQFVRIIETECTYTVCGFEVNLVLMLKKAVISQIVRHRNLALFCLSIDISRTFIADLCR